MFDLIYVNEALTSLLQIMFCVMFSCFFGSCIIRWNHSRLLIRKVHLTLHFISDATFSGLIYIHHFIFGTETWYMIMNHKIQDL